MGEMSFRRREIGSRNRGVLEDPQSTYLMIFLLF